MREFSIGKEDSKYLREIAKKLNMSESEVISKGLQLMSVIAEHPGNSDEERPSLLIHDKDKEIKVRVF